VVEVDLKAAVSVAHEAHGEVGDGEVAACVLEQLVAHDNGVLLASDDACNVEVSRGPRLDGKATVLSEFWVAAHEVGESTLLCATEGEVARGKSGLEEYCALAVGIDSVDGSLSDSLVVASLTVGLGDGAKTVAPGLEHRFDFVLGDLAGAHGSSLEAEHILKRREEKRREVNVSASIVIHCHRCCITSIAFD
jgi:hypothetical protein